MTNQPTNPEPAIEIDYREVARRVTRMMEALLVSPEVLFPSVESTAQAWEHWSEQAEWMLRAEQTYLASKGVTPAEDPRDAEIRELKLDKDTLVRNQIVSLDEMRKLRDLADHWCRRALAAESKPVAPVEKPADGPYTSEGSRVLFDGSELAVARTETLAHKMALLLNIGHATEQFEKPAESAPAGRFSYKPAEAKEPTRTERLVRLAREAKALKLQPWLTTSAVLHLDHPIVKATEAAAVRAALGEA